MIKNQSVISISGDKLIGNLVESKKTIIGDMKGIFQDEEAREQIPAGTLVYEVDAYHPVEINTLGGLFYGITRLQSGMVGKEYFMTRGHFHALSDRAEFYWGIYGEGVLILMSRDRQVRTEKMESGSLHYIPADTAHRVVNTGSDTLSFGACWPSDAGYDYLEIEKHGFAANLINNAGIPILVPKR